MCRLQIKAKRTGEAKLLQPLYEGYGAFYLKPLKRMHSRRKHTYSQSRCNGHILFVLMGEREQKRVRANGFFMMEKFHSGSKPLAGGSN